MRYRILIFIYILLQFLLLSCTVPQEIPQSELKHIQGAVVQGDLIGFRLRGDNGRILRIDAGDDVEYEPSDLHVYHGDRVRVTYYTVIKDGEDLNKALKIVLLESNKKRIDLTGGSIEGIIRSSDVMRYFIYLPKYEMTVAFYKNENVEKDPENWWPEHGDKVRVEFAYDSGRFIRKYKCEKMKLYDRREVLNDKSETGLVTKISNQTEGQRLPTSFTYKLKNGETLKMSVGRETKIVPENLKIKAGYPYNIAYYKLLADDLSFHHVAVKIKQEKSATLAPLFSTVWKKRYKEKIAIALRKQPKKDFIKIPDMILKYNFFDSLLNPNGTFKNEFVDNGDGTITDLSTALMWQKHGSAKALNNTDAIYYIVELNIKSFEGYTNWRMPTIEELSSLLETKRLRGLHINPLFDKKQIRCWSSDRTDPLQSGPYTAVWVVDYSYGTARKANWLNKKGSWWKDTYIYYPENYVRAVRSLK